MIGNGSKAGVATHAVHDGVDEAERHDKDEDVLALPVDRVHPES